MSSCPSCVPEGLSWFHLFVPLLALTGDRDTADRDGPCEHQRLTLCLHVRTLLPDIADIDERDEPCLRGNRNGDVRTDAPHAVLVGNGDVRRQGRHGELVRRDLPLCVGGRGYA